MKKTLRNIIAWPLFVAGGLGILGGCVPEKPKGYEDCGGSCKFNGYVVDKYNSIMGYKSFLVDCGNFRLHVGTNHGAWRRVGEGDNVFLEGKLGGLSGDAESQFGEQDEPVYNLLNVHLEKR